MAGNVRQVAPKATLRSQPRPLATTVVQDNAQYVWRVLRYLGVAEQDLPDIAQEVFLVVVRSLESFDERATLRTWLYGICVNRERHYRRTHARRREVSSELLPDRNVEAQQNENVERKELRDILLTALDELADEKRVVFVLHEIEGLPIHQVVAILNIPLGTGYSRLRAAKQRLTEALERQGVRPVGNS